MTVLPFGPIPTLPPPNWKYGKLVACFTICESDCLAVWLFDRVTVWLSYCLTFRLSDCLTVWLSDCLTVRLSDCLTVWLSDCLTVWQSDCMTVRLSYCLIVWLSDCLTVWLKTVWLNVPKIKPLKKGNSKATRISPKKQLKATKTTKYFETSHRNCLKKPTCVHASDVESLDVLG